MGQEWTLTDNTSAKGGYLRLCRDGKRVCDFFPFAKGTDEAWVREQAKLLLDTMNGAR